MAAGGANWVWQNSRASNGSLIVLLAIVDECGKGETAEMKVAEIAKKARLSERGVQAAVRDLIALGELSVIPATGRGNRNRYSPCPVKGADSAPNPAYTAPFTERVQNLHPADSAPFERRSPSSETKGAESAPQEISNVFVSSTGSSLAEVKDVPAKPSRRRSDGREDIDRLCAHLASRIEGNGANRPAVNEKWRDAARLMLDNDKRTEEHVHAAIDWCQDHEFWRANILSMPKLREKYEQLRMQAMRARSSSRQPQGSDYDDARKIARELDALEAI